MSFASAADLAARFGSQELLLLADRDGDGVADDGVIEAALQDADAEIVSLVAGAAAIDADDPPLNLVRVACDVARYRLYGASPTEDVRKRYEDAVKWLRLVAAGQASLDGGAAAPAAPQASPRPAATEPGRRVFRSSARDCR